MLPKSDTSELGCNMLTSLPGNNMWSGAVPNNTRKSPKFLVFWARGVGLRAIQFAALKLNWPSRSVSIPRSHKNTDAKWHRVAAEVCVRIHCSKAET